MATEEKEADSTDMMTVKEAAERLGVSRAAIYEAMAAGKLKYVEKYGKRLLYEKSVAVYSPRAYRDRRSPKQPA